MSPLSSRHHGIMAKLNLASTLSFDSSKQTTADYWDRIFRDLAGFFMSEEFRKGLLGSCRLVRKRLLPT